MKVAMIGLRGIPAKSGGVENVVHSLAPRLVKLGADVTVYCRNPYCPERPSEFKGVKLRYFPTINTKFTESIVHSTLATFHSMFRDFDVVHYHAMGNAMFSILPRIFGKKTVVTLHGLDYEREKWGLFAKAYLKLNERAALLFPNALTAVSEKIRDHYDGSYKKKITYIPNGVELQETMPIKNLKRFGLKKGRFILYLGRIVPEKGIHFLIDAFSKIETDMKLVIAGDATHTDSYHDMVVGKARQDPRIVFTGPLYGDDKSEAFSNAFLFVLPSTIEGMPIVLLDAMGYGLCTLSSDIEENRALVGTHGFSFISKNAENLKEKLIYMLRHPKELEAKGMSARSYVKSRFDWDRIAAEYMSVYEKIAMRE